MVTGTKRARAREDSVLLLSLVLPTWRINLECWLLGRRLMPVGLEVEVCAGLTTLDDVLLCSICGCVEKQTPRLLVGGIKRWLM